MLSFFTALPAWVSSSQHIPLPGTEGSPGERGERQWRKKEGKTTDQTSKPANTNAFLWVSKRTNVPYPGFLKRTRRSWKGEIRRKEQARTRNKRKAPGRACTKSRRKEESMRGKEIGGRRRQLWERERKRVLDEARQRRRGTQQQNECFLDCHAPPLPPTELLPHHRVKRQARVRERESSHALLLSPARWWRRRPKTPALCRLPEDKNWPGRRGGKRGVREGRGGHTAPRRVRENDCWRQKWVCS